MKLIKIYHKLFMYHVHFIYTKDDDEMDENQIKKDHKKILKPSSSPQQQQQQQQQQQHDQEVPAKQPSSLTLSTNENNLNTRDMKEFINSVNLDDFDNVLNNQRKNIQANTFENQVAEWLDLKDIRYLHEKQLRILNDKGLVHATPDFLILDEYYINDYKIRWIDVKTTYGCYIHHNSSMILSLKRQVEKYQKAYGNGMLIYNHGYCESLRLYIQNTLSSRKVLFLDGVHIHGQKYGITQTSAIRSKVHQKKKKKNK